MIHRSKVPIWFPLIMILGLAAGAVALLPLFKTQPLTLKGAIVREDPDTLKESPIAGAEITFGNGFPGGQSRSDSSGFFSITLPKRIRRGHALTLTIRHPEYQPLVLKEHVGDKLYILRMVPVRRPTQAESNRPEVVIGNVLARYSIKTTTDVNIGSAVKTFQVENVANVPCNGHLPCSPDGRWRATVGSASLDAGPGNEFRNVRASCIAGPCPFTKIEISGSSQVGRELNVSALNWGDTATFLLEAEVFHPMASDVIRESYPVIFGPSVNFTLPSAAEGVSIEAEVNGETVIFPLGPELVLSWADCNGRENRDQGRVYRCELKRGYRFK